MAHTNIESIDLKLQQLKNQRAQLLARQCATERKRITRQAIIIGKWIMARKPELVIAIAKVLVRPQDRWAFGLPPTISDAPAPLGTTHVDILLPEEDKAAVPPAVIRSPE